MNDNKDEAIPLLIYDHQSKSKILILPYRFYFVGERRSCS